MTMTAVLSSSAAGPLAASGDTAAATGAVRIILRVEGAVALLFCLAFYALIGANWGYFALLFWVPDLSMLGYLFGSRIGTTVYNAAHTSALPMLLGTVGFFFGIGLLPALALIWAAHIGFDRMAGFGLKYPRAFGYTHLGRIGGARQDPPVV